MFCVCRCDHSLSGPADHACFVCAGVIMFCVCRCDHSLSSPPDHDCMLSVCRCDHNLGGPPDHDSFVCTDVIMFCVCRCDHSLSSPPDPVVDDCGDDDRQSQRVGHEVHAVHCSSQHLPQSQ